MSRNHNKLFNLHLGKSPVSEAVQRMLKKMNLKSEVKLMEAKMEDGTIVEADAWEVGQVVSMQTPEGDSAPVPAGAYELEDIGVIGVNDTSTIVEFEPAEEAPATEEAPADESSAAAEETELQKLSKRFDELSEQLKKLSAENEQGKTELSKANATIEKMKAELAASPATDTPLTHKPDAEPLTQSSRVQFSKNRRKTSSDRVMDKLSNFQKN